MPRTKNWKSRAAFPRVSALWALLPALLACATGAAAPSGGASAEGGDEERPVSLLVVIVVDQLRADLLERYAPLFTGGLKTLLEEGRVFSNALHDHAQTETSPGHATISTGVYPGRAGVPSNAWREGEGNDERVVYNVVDPGESLVGISGLPGSSPQVLWREGLADWVRKADPDARMVSISAKDRAAVLMAGKSKSEVYWFESRVGRFVTSTYYRNRNPNWLNRFNEEGMARYLADSVWVSTVPPEHASLSAPDTAVFEGDGVHSFFPHRFVDAIPDAVPGDFFFWFEATPMLDEATLDVAMMAMEEEDLGQSDDRTDFLSISFSQTDRIGHAYGPLSREQMDNLLRLDRVLDRLFRHLDQEVGRDRYLLGFTSDHGVMDNPERIEGGGVRLTDEHRFKLEQALSAAARAGGSRSDLSTAQAMVESMRELPFVGPLYLRERLKDSPAGDSLGQLFRHSLTKDRPGGLLSRYGVEMWWAENILVWGLPFGSTHGSPYHYDRWVPLIFLGPGIEAGTEERPVRPLDLAPSLASLAGIPYPQDLDGVPLLPGGG